MINYGIIITHFVSRTVIINDGPKLFCLFFCFMHHLQENEAINLNYSYFSIFLSLHPSHLPCAVLQKKNKIKKLILKKEIAMTYQFGFERYFLFLYSFISWRCIFFSRNENKGTEKMRSAMSSSLFDVLFSLGPRNKST